MSIIPGWFVHQPSQPSCGACEQEGSGRSQRLSLLFLLCLEKLQSWEPRLLWTLGLSSVGDLVSEWDRAQTVGQSVLWWEEVSADGTSTLEQNQWSTPSCSPRKKATLTVSPVVTPAFPQKHAWCYLFRTEDPGDAKENDLSHIDRGCELRSNGSSESPQALRKVWTWKPRYCFCFFSFFRSWGWVED